MKTNFILTISILLIIISCKKETITIDEEKDKQESLSWELGKNTFTYNIDSIDRHFVLHVPISYDSTIATPLVIMFHGSGGTGEKMYNITEWVNKSEQEGFIVAFPTSLKYFVVAKNKFQTKWSKYNIEKQLSIESNVIDDVPFIELMILSLKATFNIDDKRVFASGFSNGGGFCRSRLMLEMSDVFASFTGAGGWGLHYDQRNIHPSEPVAQYYILGNIDPKILENIGRSQPLPMNIDSLFNIEENAFELTCSNLAIASGLDTLYRVDYNINNSRITYDQQNGVKQDNELILHLIKDLLHKYPKPDNNPSKFSGVDTFWEFYKKHPKT